VNLAYGLNPFLGTNILNRGGGTVFIIGNGFSATGGNWVLIGGNGGWWQFYDGVPGYSDTSYRFISLNAPPLAPGSYTIQVWNGYAQYYSNPLNVTVQ